MRTYLTPGVYFEIVDTSEYGDISGSHGCRCFRGRGGPGGRCIARRRSNLGRSFRRRSAAFFPMHTLAYCGECIFPEWRRKTLRCAGRGSRGYDDYESAVAQPSDGFSSIVLSTQGFAAGAVAAHSKMAFANAVGTQPADRNEVPTLVRWEGFPQGSLVQITQAVPFFQAWHDVVSVDATMSRLYWNTALESDFTLSAAMSFSSFHEEDLVVSGVDASTATLTWTVGLGAEFNLTQSIQFATGAAASNGTLNDKRRCPNTLSRGGESRLLGRRDLSAGDAHEPSRHGQRLRLRSQLREQAR